MGNTLTPQGLPRDFTEVESLQSRSFTGLYQGVTKSVATIVHDRELFWFRHLKTWEHCIHVLYVSPMIGTHFRWVVTSYFPPAEYTSFRSVYPLLKDLYKQGIVHGDFSPPHLKWNGHRVVLSGFEYTSLPLVFYWGDLGTYLHAIPPNEFVNQLLWYAIIHKESFGLKSPKTFMELVESKHALMYTFAWECVLPPASVKRMEGRPFWDEKRRSFPSEAFTNPLEFDLLDFARAGFASSHLHETPS
jgi:hypothetical protein